MRQGGIVVAVVGAMVLSGGTESRAASRQVDMVRYVALGDSLTAGFAAGSLYRAAQLGSYPRLIARQARGTAAPYEQPWMTDPGIPARILLRSSPLATVSPGSGLGSPVNLTLPRPYDNLAVPGAKAEDLLRTSSDGGGLHDLVLRGIGTQLEQALLLQPTFVSLWVGATDVFGAAISGIVLDGVTLTPTDRFSADFAAVLRSLVAGGVHMGAVATIPRVTDLPFVTTLVTEAVDWTTGVPLEVDGLPVPLMGPEGLLAPGDFVLLTASQLLARGDGVPVDLGGSGVPLPDEVILSRIEALQINRRIEEYNRVIRRAAAEAGFAVVEIGKLFAEWSRAGVVVGSERFSSHYLAGGLFSLDGVHPSTLGQALVANAFIEGINRAYGSEIPVLRLAALTSDVLDRRFTRDPVGRFTFTSGAYKNLRFGLGVPRPRRLRRLKQKAIQRLPDLDRQRRQQRFELPAAPRMAARLAPAAARAVAPTPAL